MKKSPVLILFLIVAALGAMIFLHRWSVERKDRVQAHIELLEHRESALRDMSVSLERYRRMSAHFRKMSQAEIDQAKDTFRGSMSAGLTKMEELDPDSAENSKMDSIRHDLDGMLGIAASFERTSLSKDAYQRPEMVALHERIEGELKQFGTGTESRITKLQEQALDSHDHAMPVLAALAGLIVLLFLINFWREQWFYERPLLKMHSYAKGLREGTLDLARMKPLCDRFGEIQDAFSQLTQMVQGHARERHKFILDVVSDLRSPLVMLMEGKHLLMRPYDSSCAAEELRAVDSVKRGLAMLSGSLEDMEDIVEYARLDSRLDENLIDLSEKVAEVARVLNAGPGLEKQIRVSVPPMPIWMQIDARRFERVLMQVITKVASTLTQGTGIQVTINQPTQGAFRGVEILVQDIERAREQGGKAFGSGPELDVLKHWIAEKGLGMTLAHRVIKAQGGTLTASGVVGTSVQIAIRLPQERLAQVGLIAAPRGLEVRLERESRLTETALQ